MNIYELLPEKISDETAYHLVNILMNIALELDTHYFAQARRYANSEQLEYPDYLRYELDDELPF